MNKIALIINTISKNSDIWEPFFDSIDDYIPENFFSKKYVFVDHTDTSEIPEEYTIVNYDTDKKYRDQFLQCVDNVEEEYCVYISEDYILYDDIKVNKINDFIDILKKDSNISFIRFMRGGVYDGPFEEHSDNLFYLLTDQDYLRQPHIHERLPNETLAYNQRKRPQAVLAHGRRARASKKRGRAYRFGKLRK